MCALTRHLNRMKLTDAYIDILITPLKSRRSQLSAKCLTEIRKALEHTFMPYIQKQKEIFGEDGGFLSLLSFLAVQNSEGTSLR